MNPREPRPARHLAPALALVLACSSGQPPSTANAPAPAPPSPAPLTRLPPDVPPDPHSFSRPDAVRTRHLDLDLDVDFATSTLRGVATYTLTRSDPAAPLRLDALALAIDAVEVAPTAGDFAPATWSIGHPHPLLGAPLTIDLPADADRARIRYHTTPATTGLHWLEPSQTAGHTHPFLYSQSQAIHARTWIPCQDSPGVRFTYSASVAVDRPLQPLMAADYRGVDGGGRHRFALDQPIPAYLVALAVGDLERREVGPRSAVWAEPITAPAAATELQDLEAMLRAVEALYGPYRWGRYDVLVLPPSFPFGGMENPRVTFATPTILAGDRSLVSLIAHEIAHSWSGNLVTGRTWVDLWLNEGVTTYVERRILEALYGRERAEMEAALALASLRATLDALPPSAQILAPAHVDDPEAIDSDIAYEKGALFLRAIEEALGRERFDPLLRRWFDDHAFTSQGTADFVAFLRAELAASPAPPIDLDAWLHAPGLPPGAPEPRAAAFVEVEASARAWIAGGLPTAALAARGWGTQHWLHFLAQIPADTAPPRLTELDRALGLTNTGNHELLAAWLVVALRHGVDVDMRLRWFLGTVGRRKYLVPIYRELVAIDPHRAQTIYEAARPAYHPICQQTLDALVGRPVDTLTGPGLGSAP